MVYPMLSLIMLVPLNLLSETQPEHLTFEKGVGLVANLAIIAALLVAANQMRLTGGQLQDSKNAAKISRSLTLFSMAILRDTRPARVRPKSAVGCLRSRRRRHRLTLRQVHI